MKAISLYRFNEMLNTVFSPTRSDFENDILTFAPDFHAACRTMRLQLSSDATASECFSPNSRSTLSLIILTLIMIPQREHHAGAYFAFIAAVMKVMISGLILVLG